MRQVYKGQPFSGAFFAPLLDAPLDRQVQVLYSMLYRGRILLPDLFVRQTGGVFPDSAIAAQLQERLRVAFEQRFAGGITEEETSRPPIELIDEILEPFNRELKESIGMDVVLLRFTEFGLSDSDRALLENARRTPDEPQPALEQETETPPPAPTQAAEPEVPAQPEEPIAEPEPDMVPAAPAPEPQPNRWICSCGRQNDRKFCPACGTPRSFARWICGECGTENEGKFCYYCGRPAQENA